MSSEPPLTFALKTENTLASKKYRKKRTQLTNVFRMLDCKEDKI